MTTMLLGLALAGSLAASAAADEPGFFSRFLPGGGTAAAPAPTSAPAAPKPAGAPEVPSGPTDANPFNNGSGGLINAIRGGPSGGCDGVACMFMGGETAGRPPGSPPAASAPAGASVAADATPDRATRSHPVVDDRVSPRKERCAAPANDPWRCYR